jgi:hypothetical protein
MRAIAHEVNRARAVQPSALRRRAGIIVVVGMRLPWIAYRRVGLLARVRNHDDDDACTSAYNFATTEENREEMGPRIAGSFQDRRCIPRRQDAIDVTTRASP